MDVIVVGAGMAGLAAARRLAETGLRVTLIEARDRVGGRIHTVAAARGGLPIELGAEFIHGLPPELIQLVDEAGLTRFELEGDARCFRDRQLELCSDQPEVEQLFHQLGRLEPPLVDLSFTEFVAQRGFSAEAIAWATHYIEGFNAADANRISIHSLGRQQAAEDAISGDRLFRVAEGYAQLPAFLLRRFQQAGGESFLSTPVEAIAWTPGAVEVATAGGLVFRASTAIVTLPLGVLQRRSVPFLPHPAATFDAADQLAMGPAARVVYEFDSTFLRNHRRLWDLSFAFAPEATPPTWWTANPREGSMITGWVAGRKASKLKIADLPETGLATLADLLSSPLEEVRKHLVRWHQHDWQKDTHCLGAYTYVPRGAIHASDELSVPVESTLFFAGEHTDTTGHWGTVHAALRSGYRAAEQVLAKAS